MCVNTAQPCNGIGGGGAQFFSHSFEGDMNIFTITQNISQPQAIIVDNSLMSDFNLYNKIITRDDS